MTLFGMFAGAICAFFFATPRAFGRHLAQVVEGFETERARRAIRPERRRL
ncbi:MAG: hypothetical protein AB1698_03265 [Pseudomonadota bacterium]